MAMIEVIMLGYSLGDLKARTANCCLLNDELICFPIAWSPS